MVMTTKIRRQLSIETYKISFTVPLVSALICRTSLRKALPAMTPLYKELLKAATANSDEHRSRLMVVKLPSVEVEHRVEGERHEKSREG